MSSKTDERIPLKWIALAAVVSICFAALVAAFLFEPPEKPIDKNKQKKQDQGPEKKRTPVIDDQGNLSPLTIRLEQLNGDGSVLPPGAEATGQTVILRAHFQTHDRYRLSVFTLNGVTHPGATKKGVMEVKTPRLASGPYDWIFTLKTRNSESKALDFSEQMPDFIIPEPPKAEEDQEDQQDDKDPETGALGGNSTISGGGGRSGPLDSIPRPVTPLWELLTSRSLLIGAVVAVIVSLAILLIRRHRKGSPA